MFFRQDNHPSSAPKPNTATTQRPETPELFWKVSHETLSSFTFFCVFPISTRVFTPECFLLRLCQMSASRYASGSTPKALLMVKSMHGDTKVNALGLRNHKRKQETTSLAKGGVRSVANCLRYRICSICAYFSVARFIISGGYYRSSFESVIESIIR